VLGPLRVVGEQEIELPRASHRRLLSILALDANHRVSTDVLIDRNWGEVVPASARAAIQTHVSALRKLLPADTIVTEGYGYRLDLFGHELDAERLTELGAQAHRAGTARQWVAAIGAADAALSLWRGAPYEELADDDFARSEIARLAELRLALLEIRAGALLGLGREQEALPELERLVVENPLRERLWEHLMTARYRAGRHADALAAYREAWNALADIGLEPSDALRRLEQRILLHDQALAPARHNLPTELTEFTGREQELAEIASLLDGHRLVTLVGVGGVGKTRLALRVARDALGAFRDGCRLVELAPLRDPALVPLELARELGMRPRADSATAAVAASLAGDAFLLVLDNCEHLLDAAGALVRALLEVAPAVRVLATSREPLRIPGEVVYDVPSLSFPHEVVGPGEAETFDAVRLFADRAVLVRPGFALDDANTAAVATICRRLDGMPLAIELAAGRVASLSPETIAENLDDRFRILTGGSRVGPERHRSLDAALGWSYDLLDESERLVFARLGVFRGGFNFDAATLVCSGGDIAEADVLPLVSGLVEKSLVSTYLLESSNRYRLLETVREYAVVRLREIDDPESTWRRHLEWHVALATDTLDRVHGPGRWELLGNVATESDDLEAALELALDRGLDAEREGLARALAWQEYDDGLFERAIVHLRTALGRSTPAAAEAECRSLLGSALFHAGEDDEALAESRQAVTIATALPPSAAKVWVLTALARLHLLVLDRDPAAAIPLCTAALADAEASGDPFALIYARRALARALTWNGDVDGGLEQQDAALKLARDAGDPAFLFDTLQSGLTLLYLHPVARRTEPSRIAHELLSRFPLDERLCLDYWLPYALCQAGDWDVAEVVVERAATWRLEGWDLACHLITRAMLRWMQGRLGDARAALAELGNASVHPRWYDDYYALLTEIAADEGRVADAREAADAYLAIDVHPSEEAAKLAVLAPLVRAEVDAALAEGATERDRHLDAAHEAASRARDIFARFPPPTGGSLQIETAATYLALAEAELSRCVGPDPGLWSDVVGRADYLYTRLYGRLRLAEALLEAGRTADGCDELRRTYDDASEAGAAAITARVARLASKAGVDVNPRQRPIRR
jgi:predicted ATPase/DNA-binding SARP family transcriptional activator